ncbi:RNA polymerase sigma-70 factor [Sinomicrobium soli]|nr:RNA polymerase sigma-70 factor [Sinomicrobium sp. N-1-3-6]
MEDGFLVSRVRDHDEQAFRELYHKYYHAVYGFGMSLVKSSTIAEEIVQEVFMQVWLHCESLDPKLSFKSYILTITRNKSLDFLRKAGNNEVLRKEIFYTGTYVHNQTSDYVDDADYEEWKNKAIASLSPKRRRIFEMSRKEGMSYEDIARELGISTNTVKVQMSKALRNIRIFLEVNTDLTFTLIFLLYSIIGM